MKVKYVEIVVPTSDFGTEVKVDSMNNTSIFVNNVICPETDGVVTIPTVEVGDIVDLNTRHSGWRGRVVDIYSGKVILRVEAEGYFESFRAGRSGLLQWKINDTAWAVVETSLHDRPIPWDIYVATKAAASCATESLSTSARDKTWSQLLEVCMATVPPLVVPEWWEE